MDEKYLNVIVLIIGIAFISAVIIATSPQVELPEEIKSLDSGQIDGMINDTPTAFAALNHYFGTTVITLNETRAVPDTHNPKTEEPEPEIEYDDDDDDLFLEIVKDRGENISIIALLCTEAVQGGNRKLLVEQSEELRSLSQKTWDDVEALNVSKYLITEKRSFQQVMVRMIATASLLTRGLPGSEGERQKMVADIQDVCDQFNDVRIDISKKAFKLNGSHPAYGVYQIQVDRTRELNRANDELDYSQLYPLPDDLIPIGRGFKYMDSRKSNDITISPRYARIHSSYWYKDEGTGNTIYVPAPEGTSFLSVHFRIAHSGNRDGKSYTIQTPALSAFTLHGVGEEFTPLKTSAYTSLGEMYGQKTLNRNELFEGTILFEVPYGMRTSDAYITVNLGSIYGKPGWSLVSSR